MSLPEEQNVEELLAADHRALDVLLRELIADFYVSDASATFSRLDLFWARLAMHIRAENLHLFPAILDAGDDKFGGQDSVEAREALDKLRRDHDFFMHELAEAVNVMRAFMKSDTQMNAVEQLQPVREIVIRVAERLEAHNRLEEGLVYRLPETLLEPARQSELAAEVRRELENLPPRFNMVWQRKEVSGNDRGE